MLLIVETPEAAVNYIRDSIDEILKKAGHTGISSMELEIECAKIPPYKVIFALEDLVAPEDSNIYLIPGVENHPNFNRYLLALKVLGLPARALNVSDFYSVEPATVEIEMKRPPIEEKTNQGKKHGTNRS